MHKLVGLFVVVSVLGAALIDQQLSAPETVSAKPAALQEPAGVEQRSETARRASDRRSGRRTSGQAFVKRDSRGHYTMNARLNGRSMAVLVDTGASAVAINERTARLIGLDVGPGDFIHIANTANGQVKMAVGTINSIEVDGVFVRNVRAAILPDRSLSDVLLGMSFLNKLDRFEFRDREMVLYE